MANVLMHKITESYRQLRKNVKWLPLFFLIDALFLVITGWLFVTLQGKIVNKLASISDALEGVTGLEAQAAILPQVKTVFFLMVLLLVGLFCSWVVFQGLNLSLVNMRLKRKQFMLRFLLYHLVAVPVLALAFVMYLQTLVYNEKMLLELIPSWLIHGGFLVLFIFLFYLMYVHYHLLARRKQGLFTVPFKKKEFGARFALSGVALVLLLILFYVVFWWNFYLSLVILAGILVFLSYLRYLLLN
ncbi:MAG: hypothetical protein ACQESG_04385 [Nanobdellota archaeon]